jgi:hypothetical protein
MFQRSDHSLAFPCIRSGGGAFCILSRSERQYAMTCALTLSQRFLSTKLTISPAQHAQVSATIEPSTISHCFHLVFPPRDHIPEQQQTCPPMSPLSPPRTYSHTIPISITSPRSVPRCSYTMSTVKFLPSLQRIRAMTTRKAAVPCTCGN